MKEKDILKDLMRKMDKDEIVQAMNEAQEEIEAENKKEEVVEGAREDLIAAIETYCDALGIKLEGDSTKAITSLLKDFESGKFSSSIFSTPFTRFFKFF